MSKINRKFFFDVVRLHLYEGRLSKKQVEGMTCLLYTSDAADDSALV